MNFKGEYDEDARLRESRKILHKYPSRIPIIVEKHDSCQFQVVNKKKYLAPKDLTMNLFIFEIRKRIELEPSQSLFVTVNGKLVTSSHTLGEIYEKEADKDGFLYMIYTSENTFG
jgi:GABA(A) receptor-associated protein